MGMTIEEKFKTLQDEYTYLMGKYQMMQADYENRLKADMVAMLDKIRAEIEEYKSRQLTLAIGVEDLEEGKQIALEYVLAIFEKYKVESEVNK